jgi:hypothetical protein
MRQRAMISKIFSPKALIWWGPISIAVIIFAYILLGISGRSLSGATEGMFRAVTVRNALQRYHDDNGVMPERLSLLSPKYISFEKISVWFPILGRSENLPKWAQDVSRIDENCGYLYFPKSVFVNSEELGSGAKTIQIVLCERPSDCFSKSQLPVHAVLSDLSVRTISFKELQMALSRTPPTLTSQ